MKTTVVISLLLLLIACRRPSGDTRQNFITGTYATWERGYLSRSWDTLIVTRYSADPLGFKVSHHSCFQRTVDPFFYPPVHIHNFWTGYYDPTTHTLTAPAGLPDLVFAPSQYTLTASGLLYVRIQ